MSEHQDAWAGYEEAKIRDGFTAFRASPEYPRAVEIAASKGYRPATLHECLYAAPNDIYNCPSIGGVWCKA